MQWPGIDYHNNPLYTELNTCIHCFNHQILVVHYIHPQGTHIKYIKKFIMSDCQNEKYHVIIKNSFFQKVSIKILTNFYHLLYVIYLPY